MLCAMVQQCQQRLQLGARQLFLNFRRECFPGDMLRPLLADFNHRLFQPLQFLTWHPAILNRVGRDTKNRPASSFPLRGDCYNPRSFLP